MSQPQRLIKHFITRRYLHYAKTTTSNMYPFMTYIHYGKIFICGGTLIAPNWVMTAAHCVNNFWKYGPVDQLQVTIGCNNIFEDQKYSAKLIKIIIHENYAEPSLRNDIALIKLENNIPSEYGRPVNIPNVEVNATDRRAVILGWGENEFNSYLGYLRCGLVNITSCPWFLNSDLNKICSLVPKRSFKTITDTGDSGGALLLPRNDGFIQIGIISSEWEPFDDVYCKCCIFTDVTKYLDWIRFNLFYQ
ncbi:chymotrypsin-like [Chrysoperla carnea]|uniref:chymotrypsin-like n=1 Tax=Chrysoperla carnea TaxID=189513 RepID=UPI001D07D895|nr:chymotrypsin-like [Chrysoperla carnea]